MWMALIIAAGAGAGAFWISELTYSSVEGTWTSEAPLLGTHSCCVFFSSSESRHRIKTCCVKFCYPMVAERNDYGSGCCTSYSCVHHCPPDGLHRVLGALPNEGPQRVAIENQHGNAEYFVRGEDAWFKEVFLA